MNKYSKHDNKNINSLNQNEFDFELESSPKVEVFNNSNQLTPVNITIDDKKDFSEMANQPPTSKD